MASDMKALEHLEEISNNLNDIRKEIGAVANALIQIQKALEQMAERA